MRITSPKPIVAAALGALAAGLIVGLGTSSAAAPTHTGITKRLVYVERELASPTIDLGKRGFSRLDRQTITSEILDLHGHVVGRIDDDCGITDVGKRAGAVCSSAITLRGGQLVGTRFASLTGPDTAAQPITGGSGAYLDARGELRPLGKTKAGLKFEIDLTT